MDPSWDNEICNIRRSYGSFMKFFGVIHWCFSSSSSLSFRTWDSFFGAQVAKLTSGPSNLLQAAKQLGHQVKDRADWRVGWNGCEIYRYVLYTHIYVCNNMYYIAVYIHIIYIYTCMYIYILFYYIYIYFYKYIYIYIYIYTKQT